MSQNPKIQAIIEDYQHILHVLNRMQKKTSVNQIDIDLIVRKTQDVYEKVLILQSEEGDEEIKPLNIDKASKDVEMDVSEISEDVPMEIEFEIPVKKEDERIADGEGTIQKTSPQKEKQTESKIMADQLSQERQFMYERLGSSQNPDLSSHLQSKPLKDIRDAIGINDRFQFINDLFKGKSEDFDRVINYINSASNFNSVYNYLQEHFDWDMEDDHVKKLLELARRKLIIKHNE